PPKSKTVADRQRCVGIAIVLTDKVAHVASDPGDPSGSTPVLAVGLRIFESRERSSGADCSLNCKAAIRIDRPGGLADEASREAAIGSELQGVPRASEDFTSVASDQGPFLYLPLQLNDVQRVFIGVRRR